MRCPLVPRAANRSKGARAGRGGQGGMAPRGKATESQAVLIRVSGPRRPRRPTDPRAHGWPPWVPLWDFSCRARWFWYDVRQFGSDFTFFRGKTMRVLVGVAVLIAAAGTLQADPAQGTKAEVKGLHV